VLSIGILEGYLVMMMIGIAVGAITVLVGYLEEVRVRLVTTNQLKSNKVIPMPNNYHKFSQQPITPLTSATSKT
jgi:hypothetical protein